MNLSQLKCTPGSHKRPKIVGRGPGSGHGKTSCKGEKGQLARSGPKQPGFEGGQMPLYRRLPKRGFNNKFRKDYNIINIGTLNRFTEGTEINPELLYSLRAAKKRLPIKILGDGKLDRKLIIKAHKFSKGAKKAIEEAGGAALLTAGGRGNIPLL